MATQEMADQEKQQLLEALEEKQRLREEKAQQQEKMLQQLKASQAWRVSESVKVSVKVGVKCSARTDVQAMEEKMLVGSQVMEKAMAQLGYPCVACVQCSVSQRSESLLPDCCSRNLRQEADLKKAAMEVEEKKRLEQRMPLPRICTVQCQAHFFRWNFSECDAG